MDELETLIRDTLREHAADAPRVSALTARRRSRLPAVLASAAVVAAAAALIVVLQPGRGAPPAPAAPGAATTTAPPSDAAPAGYVWASYHGIEIAVPADAQWVYVTCYLPTTSYVQFTVPGVAISCPAPNPRGPSRPPDPNAVAVTLSPTGTDTATVLHPGQRPPVTRALADAGVIVQVSAPTTAQTNLILNSIRRTPVDHLGCRDHLTTTTPTNPPAPSLVAAGPRSAVVCSYSLMGRSDQGYWLLSSHALDGHQASVLTAKFAALPAATGAAGTSTDAHPPVVDWVVFDYGTSTRTVAIQRWTYPAGQVTDGQRTVIANSAAADPPLPDI